MNQFFFYLDDVMCGSVRSRSPQLHAGSMLACFIAFDRYGLKQIISRWGNETSQDWSELQTYPRIIESDPVLDSVAKSLKAQVGKVVEIIDHAYILPSTIFLL